MNTDTKRHIDSARQVLVGVVPNPTSQIDQITNALIYKFMDDMDQASIKHGGNPSFFVGDLEKYAWTRLMDTRMGNQERMNLYGEALVKFSQAKQLPELFREIFKSAFLPYRSPETLGMFLKEIDYFDYSHPEELGNAYEYLLSIMSSQGDAGQFRTPRHIIDFIVNVVNPTKNDKVLDPACGTGGFLVSAYNHILEQHDCKNDPKKKEKPLTPDERKKLIQNFEGYDIDPTMVRISKVNMYLHKFTNPKIFQYDTLSSDERWNDKFDVILANPPFMSPKGGIKPHSKFSIQSSRSEVLFVDYIMNHLRPKGRAGIIVPEGIIFQSQKSHTDLRKNLINDGLYAVVSLPSGIFNPYAGVKTSILLFNNEVAKQRNEILFVKIQNDGTDLGTKKRITLANDLPTALEILNKWDTGKKIENKLALYVQKSKIAEDGDYNFSSDRYRVATDYTNAKWPMVKLGEVAEVLNGYAFKSDKYTSEGIRIIRITNVQKGEIRDDEPKFYSLNTAKEIKKFMLNKNDLLISLTGNIGRVGLLKDNLLPAALNQRVGCMRVINPNTILIDYLFHILNTEKFEYECMNYSNGIAQKNLSTEWLKKYIIPLPPIEIQEQIVAELNSYQNIIAGAKQIAENWKPKIEIDPKWKKVKLGDAFKIESGGTPSSTEKKYWNGNIKWATLIDIPQTIEIITDTKRQITNEGLKNSSSKLLPEGTVLVSSRATIGRIAIAGAKMATNQGFKNIIVDRENESLYVAYILSEKVEEMNLLASGGTFNEISKTNFSNIQIPLPPLKIQKQIVEKIEAERALVESSKKLIELYEQKTKDVIAKLWTK